MLRLQAQRKTLKKYNKWNNRQEKNATNEVLRGLKSATRIQTYEDENGFKPYDKALKQVFKAGSEEEQKHFSLVMDMWNFGESRILRRENELVH